MPMSYLYGKRFVGPITPLILSLREELYLQPYESVKWKQVRHLCAEEDLYYPHSLIQDFLWDSLYLMSEPLLTRWPFNQLVRKKALEVTMKHIHYEDENSRYITIGCVEKVLCMLSCWVEDPDGVAFKRHLARVPDYLWVGEDGMKVQSFGSQLWDATFGFQALYTSELGEEIKPTLAKAFDFIKKSQVLNHEFNPIIFLFFSCYNLVALTDQNELQICSRLWIIQQVTSWACIVTFLKDHGLSLIRIMAGNFLIVQPKL
jgi:beta-amyrin synthase